MSRLRALLRLAGLLIVDAVLLPPALLTRVLALAGAERLAMAWAATLQAWWGRASLAVLGVEVDPARPPAGGPFLVCANHLGYLDVLVLSARVGGRFVAMSEIAGWPALGWLARSSGTLFVDRDRKRDVLRVGQEIEATLAAGVNVLFFPEGRAGPGDRVRPLRTPLFQAAAQLGVPCVVAALGYETPENPVSPAWTVAWWGGMDFPRHAWRLLHLDGIRARLAFGEEPLVAADRKALARAVQAELERLHVPCSLEPEPADNPWKDYELEAGAKSGAMRDPGLK